MKKIITALREAKTCPKCFSKNNVNNAVCVGCGTSLGR